MVFINQQVIIKITADFPCSMHCCSQLKGCQTGKKRIGLRQTGDLDRLCKLEFRIDSGGGFLDGIFERRNGGIDTFGKRLKFLRAIDFNLFLQIPAGNPFQGGVHFIDTIDDNLLHQ